VQSLQQQWQQATQKAPADATHNDRYQHALAVVNAIINEHASQQQAESTASQQQHEVQQQLEDLLTQVNDKEQQLSHEYLNENLKSINEKWQQIVAVLNCR
jgi:glucan phosphorylase